ncbi:ras-related protein Rab-8B [Hydra vulgaris]|uniref:ras-related protein Rab-8B n=1 Tax=Hydra vulgaris TaxID=6087 RepID=UPI0001925808|nr:ras-related protein Rab-8B [Hydra vulgaris]
MAAAVSFKIILVGQSGVGKTALMRRYVKRYFPEIEVSTIGIDLGTKVIDLDGIKVELKIWDSAGSEKFKSLTTSYYRNADGAILVYSLENANSLFELQSWSQEVCSHGDMIRILVGNKNDLVDERVISEDMALNFALLENIELVVECSAKRDDNVEYLFRTIAKKMLNKKLEKDNTILKSNAFKISGSKTTSTLNPRLKANTKPLFKRFCII